MWSVVGRLTFATPRPHERLVSGSHQAARRRRSQSALWKAHGHGAERRVKRPMHKIVKHSKPRFTQNPRSRTVPPGGLEPPTNGLKVHCSAIELEGLVFRCFAGTRLLQIPMLRPRPRGWPEP